MIVPALIFAFVCSASSNDVADWPGWRGPDGAGVAAGSPPVAWSEEKNIRFKVEVPGKGLSSPVVFGDFVYLTTAVPIGGGVEAESPPASAPGGGRGGRGGFMSRVAPSEHEFSVMALSRHDGSVRWSRIVKIATPHVGMHGDSSFATPTLATDGEAIVASFGSVGIFGLTMDGDVAWEVDLGDMRVTGDFGEGSSPVLFGGRVVLLWGQEGESFLVALDALSGEEAWRARQPRGTNWTTPIIAEIDGNMCAVVAGSRSSAFSLATGEELWWFGAELTDEEPEAESEDGSTDPAAGGRGGRGPGGFGGRGGRGPGGGGRARNIISSPVAGRGMIFLPMPEGVYALDPEGATGELEAGSFAWTETDDMPGIPSPIVYDGLLYIMKSGSGILSAFDAMSGEKVYGPQRMVSVQTAYASPVAAAGHLYFLGRDGTCEVIRAGAEFESLAVNNLDDKFDASPAVVGDALYLRGNKHLYCIAEGTGR